ncbi:Txe/YoeB family addiction module toxin [Candidatus Finniella inopinata]|uniref:Putative mRNA interferase YoeB n=1 Tax=Candidatus Finniella inopinata TaxID=1696036 RepID=A0A4V2E001_9PROT|nr:Txe/YoeB family addiction module toxin [Candidatus Finniella inopinata]RZI46837.1 Txe/YoeB family addiction module toxin [Candidatus Finniella inopinata]
MILFEQKAWEQYVEWQAIDKKKLLKINTLIKECLRSPFVGIGKPEPLKGDYSGFWSRRIDDVHRLIYSYENETLTIVACKYHYD